LALAPSFSIVVVSGSRNLAQRYAEVRKGIDIKIVGYPADAILQVLGANGIQNHFR
jgi:hypothetical protein